MLASVDTVFSVLDSSFSIGAEIFFRQFIRRSRAVKWMIGADFVINETSAAHDAFAFTVFPHYTDFTSTQDEIDRVFPRDIKGTQSITDDMLDYLRDPKRFHFCFLAQKNRHERDSVQQVRTTIDRAIATIRGLGTEGVPGGEERRAGYLRAFRNLRQEANANNFNYRLLSDIGILGMLAAAVMFWIVRHGNAVAFGVFPDRDKMTVGYNSVFNDMAFINFSSLCQRSGISEKRDILMPAPALLRGQELFYDPLVRIPDYVAGAISRLDYQARVVTSEHKKHGDLVEKFVSDNTNLAIMQMTESIVGMRAANISLWSHSDQQLRLSHMDRDQIVEYLAAKSSGFRQGRHRSYRDSLLDNVNNMERTIYWLEVLMKGVAAGDPGSVATFRNMQPGDPQASGL
jgi:hypothetical protein